PEVRRNRRRVPQSCSLVRRIQRRAVQGRVPPRDRVDGSPPARSVHVDEGGGSRIPGPRGVLPAPPRLPKGERSVRRGGRRRGRGTRVHPPAETGRRSVRRITLEGKCL